MSARAGLLVSACLLATPLAATAQDAADLAKAAQNPVASMISLPFQNNTNFDFGPLGKTQNVLNIQPVYPLVLNDDWNLITRTILPVISQPAFASNQDREFGLGDLNATAFFSPRASGKWTWGVGPTVSLPTATDDRLGSDSVGLGASAVVLTMPGNWVVGSLVSNVWIAGSGGRPDVSLFTWQPFLNYNIPDSGGWYLTSSPIVTANWESSSGDRWTVPLGGGVGRIFRIGNQPVNAAVQAYYNVERPDIGARWQLRAQLQLLFPK